MVLKKKYRDGQLFKPERIKNMKKTELEILDIIKDTLGVLVKDRQRKIDEIDDTMKFMGTVLDKNDIWAYSVGDVTADELYIKLKEAKGPGSYINHDLFMNILVDWMFHMGGEDL